MLVVADVAVGPIIAVFGLIVAIPVLLIIIFVEAGVLKWFEIMPPGTALRGSCAANFASALVGLALMIGATSLNSFSIYWRWEWLLFWALSVAVEGGILTLMYRQLSRRIWVPTIIMNSVSYAILIVCSLIWGF
jgi:hypothetical protein